MIPYTEHEIKVLSHFFTSTDGEEYAATDAMPSELWACLAGGASRSHLSVRDRFLQIFHDTYPSPVEYNECLEHIAQAIEAQNTSYLKPAMERATKFMTKWSINYGHNSLKDSSTDRVVVDHVSIRGAKLLEETNLGAFQEKSTRYVDFSKAEPILPALPTQEFDAWIRRVLDRSDRLYARMTRECTEYYMHTLPDADFKDKAAKKRTATAKAFDTARYCLLACKPTALAFTMPSRETERHLSNLMASDNAEVASIANNVVEGAKQVNPGLLTHLTPNKFHGARCDMSTLESELSYLIDGITIEPNIVHSSDEPLVSLHTASPNVLARLAASILQVNAPVPGRSYRATLNELIDRDVLNFDIIEHRLKSRGQYDDLPKEFGCCEFVFDIVMDYGAYRDLQRHRVGSQIVSDLNTENGYTVPSLLNLSELADLKGSYVECLNDIHALHQSLRDHCLTSEAEYFFALGHNVHFTYTCDFRQLIYLVELRTRPAGHESYRLVAQKMFDQLIDNGIDWVPEREKFVSLFRIDRSTDTTRAAQENKAQTR